MLTIILSVAGGAIALITLWIVIAVVRGKKKDRALDENIKKLKAEKESLNDAGSLTIASDETPVQTDVPKGGTIESIDIDSKDAENPVETEVENSNALDMQIPVKRIR